MPAITIEADSARVQSLLKQLAKGCSPEGFADTMKEIGEDLRYSTRQRFITGIVPDAGAKSPSQSARSSGCPRPTSAASSAPSSGN
jgi:hypothetical protein